MCIAILCCKNGNYKIFRKNTYAYGERKYGMQKYNKNSLNTYFTKKNLDRILKNSNCAVLEYKV